MTSPEVWAEYIATGSVSIRNHIVTGHIPLVRYVVARMRTGLPSHVDHEDLVSYGTFGLIDAVERYDPDRGVRFETYATTRIRGSILDELRAMDWAPRSVRSAHRDVRRAVDELAGALGRQPTHAEVAQHLGVDEAQVHEALTRAEHANVDDLTLVSREDSAFEQHPVDHTESDPALHVELTRARLALAEAMSGLAPAHQAVLQLYYRHGPDGERLKLREVGSVLGIGAGKATRLYTEACLVLRERLALA